MNGRSRLLPTLLLWIASTSLALADIAPPEPGFGGGGPAGRGAMVPIMGGLITIGLTVVVFMWMQKNKTAKS